MGKEGVIMTKNMYSLILTDAVVERIDRLAYEKGISRSQMIDHLLAKEVGLSTPEQQTRLIVRHTADRMSAATPALQMHVRSDQGSIEVATYVKFKYNPSIKYSFDIINNQGRPFGILKVSSRSTSTDLRGHLDAFLQLLAAIDQQYMQLFMISNQNEDVTGRFLRTIGLPRLFEKTDDPEVIAERLSRWILLIDDAMQAYFNALWSPLRQQEVLNIYLKNTT